MFHSRPISCLIQLSKCAVYNQFSLTIFTHFFFILPIEFTMMHLGQLHRRVFNFIRCWSLKMAKCFTIAYNCKKKTKQNTKWKVKSSKTIMLFVTGWLQALTISYLIGSFEIMMMPKDKFFLETIVANKSKISFPLASAVSWN